MKTPLRWIAPLLAVAAMTLGACGTKDDKPADTATSAPNGTTAATTPGTTASPGTTTQGTEVPGVIAVKTDTDSNLGEILVDGKGLTLYVFNDDGTDVSNCTGTCATTWLPLTGTSIEASGGLADTDFVLISRADGTKQASYKGHPLYHFKSDSKPGQTNGQGVNRKWYVLGLDGKPVSKD